MDEARQEPSLRKLVKAPEALKEGNRVIITTGREYGGWPFLRPVAH